jgi:hypothetical protein
VGRAPAYFLPAALLLAAQRAFINCESLFRPAAEMPPFFRPVLLRPAGLLPRRFAQRARAAADNLARVAADILRRPPPPAVERDGVPPSSEFKRFCKFSISRRIETASSNDLKDKSIRRL